MRQSPLAESSTLERRVEIWSPPRPSAARPVAAGRCTDEDGWSVRIYRSIHELPAAIWDEIVGPAAAPRSHAYLAAIEASLINDCRYFYPVIYDSTGRVLAHACVYTITTDLTQALPRFWQTVANAIKRLWPRFLQVKITECASPLVPGHSLSVRPGVSRTAVLRRLGGLLAELARDENSRLVVFRDFLDSERGDADALLEVGYEPASNMPLARIRVRWKTYDEYLDAMRSRYRKDLKRRLRRVARDGQRTLRLAYFADRSQLWASQVQTMYERSKGFKRERIGARYYEQIERIPTASRTLLVAERDGRATAHGLVLFDAEHTIATYFGREAGRPGNEWFYLLNEVIRLGIQRGSRYICLGLGSYDAKSLVGAEFEPLYCYVRSTLPWVNWLLRRIPDRMARLEMSSRRIFRESSSLR